MKSMLRFFLLLSCMMPAVLYAQVSASYAARLQAVLDSTCNRYHIKNASAAVWVPGSGVWKGVYGVSHAGSPLTSNMALAFNSNTKTYIAALMLKLQEEGKLQLDDTIGKWISNQPNINGKITIRQMLNHTSGLYSYTDTSALGDSIEADFARVWQPAEMLQFIGKPRFAPGAYWDYSNTGYLLAGMIAEQVTGLSVAQALRTKILAPGGFGNTWFYPQETPAALLPHFWFFNGTGIDDGADFGYTPEAFYSMAGSAGALFGTAEDNVLFWHKMSSGQLLSAASMAEWHQMIPLSSTIGYGLGVFRYKSFNGHTVYEHGGTGAGAINENLADSVTGVCISLLTHQDSADNNVLLQKVVSALHKVTNNPPTGIATVTPELDFQLYPNPAQSQLQLNGAFEGGQYAVLDMAGKVVRRGALTAGKATISVAGLENGLYCLQLLTETGVRGTRAFSILK